MKNLRPAEEHRHIFGPDPFEDLPPTGSVTIRLLTSDGRLDITEENALGEGRSPASPVFHAAHGVIGRLHQIDEAGRT
jgi:hypothetical protein